MLAKRIGACLVVLSVAACAAQGDPDPCSTLRCLANQAKQPLYRACMTDLFKRPLHPARQAAIQREYGYPLTNADTYFDWTQFGGTGPSPDQWCRRYAEAKVNYPVVIGR